MTSYLEQFHYQLYGPENGRKWIFLHGLMGSAANWRKIISGLQQTERILAFDQRGHGRSFKPENGYASEDYAQDVYQISEELKWDKFILVGHSMGGRNAMIFAHKWPQKLEKLVIVDIGPEGKLTAIKYYQQLFDSIPTPFESKLAAKEFFLNEFKQRFTLAKENVDTLGQYLYTNIEEKLDGRADWRFDKNAMLLSVSQGRAKDCWAELRQINVPTLVIRGETSAELSSDEFKRMVASNPRIQGIEIPGAGHWVHADQPQKFTEIIKDFANQAF